MLLIIGLGCIIRAHHIILWIGKSQRGGKGKEEVPEARLGRVTRLGDYVCSHGSCRCRRPPSTPSSPPFLSSRTREIPSFINGVSPASPFLSAPTHTLVKSASSLTGITHVRLIPTHVDASYPPPDVGSPPTTDVARVFKMAVVRPLERFAQGFAVRPQRRDLAPHHTLCQ